MKLLERLFEGMLWNSRLVVIFAVIASLLTAFAMFFIATVDAWFLLSHLSDYLSPALSTDHRADLRASMVTHVVEIIDGYLLATVMLIFSLGLYELFISKIEQAAESEAGSSVLLITSLDDLKSRLAKVVLMILIVKFFEHALQMNFSSSLEMLEFAGGIALIGLALYLSHAGDQHGSAPKKHSEH
ncbi:MAG TPA: YqhA family protein [Gammaproteobacteria bacterium]|nr:YqhA family protein [Gammaproteobacteria bacterium]